MATSATSAFELTRDQLIRRAFQIAGLLEASQQTEGEDVALAADILHMELHALIAEGLPVTLVERTTLPLVAATAAYTLAADTLDIAVDPQGIVGMIVPSISGAETPVRMLTRAEYLGMAGKSTSGTPTQVLVERLATVNLTFWPVPTAGTFSYSKIRFPRDMDTGSRTLDLSRRYQKAVCYAMAFQLALAKSMPLERVAFLKQEAERAKVLAITSDKENGPAQLFIARY